jgi:hypothetical protein
MEMMRMSTMLDISGFLMVEPMTVKASLVLYRISGCVSVSVVVSYGTIIGKHILNYFGAQYAIFPNAHIFATFALHLYDFSPLINIGRIVFTP